MSRESRYKLQQNYDKLGDLTDSQFLAVKALNQRMIHASNVDFEHISIVNKLGIESQIQAEQLPSEFENGNIDRIKLKTTVRNMAGGKEKTGSITIENVRDAQFDPKTGFLLIDSDKLCLTNLECKHDIEDLALLIANPEVWVAKEILSEIVGPETTLSDYQEIRDLHDREVEQNLNFDDIGFEENVEEINDRTQSQQE